MLSEYCFQSFCDDYSSEHLRLAASKQHIEAVPNGQKTLRYSKDCPIYENTH